ncbi:MAG: DUF1351 domain-containing protein [Bacillota bacterium]
MSTELAVSVKVIETKPAIVNFNYQEISNHLDSVLEKYKGLVFTEDTVSECKKTIAELRKGQKSLDEFRKATKKQLTESVTAFEDQCKKLHGKFDEVIKPLTDQNEKFELDRREKKNTEIKGIVDALILELNLTEKYASQLTIPEEYFNKGKSIKAIKAELAVTANMLKIKQDKETQDINLIKTKVELANAQYGLTNKLIAESYTRLLAYKPIEEIELLITSDAQQAQKKEEKTTEAAIAEPIVQPDIAKPEPVITPKAVIAKPIITQKTVSAEELITAVYEITGTEEQLSALEAYLDASNLKWIDRPNE